jgi:hypothetical protein
MLITKATFPSVLGCCSQAGGKQAGFSTRVSLRSAVAIAIRSLQHHWALALTNLFKMHLVSTLVILTIHAVPLVHGRNVSYFDRSKCRKFGISLQKKSGFSLNTSEYFLRTNDGTLPNSSDDMTLTVRGCNEFCGPQSFYEDALPRIMTWIILVLLLLSNIELSPADKKCYWTIVHALGDPIDSFWSIMHKIYIWERLYRLAL